MICLMCTVRTSIQGSSLCVSCKEKCEKEKCKNG